MHTTNSCLAVFGLAACSIAWTAVPGASVAAEMDAAPIAVTAANFARAETDMYFGRTVLQGGFGKLVHARQPPAIEDQKVVRMNRDTLYSSGVFDLQAGPVSITLPDAGKRFLSMQIISQDHYTTDVIYAPGRHTYAQDKVGTRYAFVLVRILVNAEDAKDIEAAHRVQDRVRTEQAQSGSFEVPRWDPVSQAKAREALSVLGSLGGVAERFGTKDQVRPVDHLIGTATGWGGNPRAAADYVSVHPDRNDGATRYRLSVPADVPVDGFWSIAVYNRQGYFEKNPKGAYSLNNLTAKPDPDGSFAVQFGGCSDQEAPSNCLPITPGWNYTVRLYRPRQQVLDRSWTFPSARVVP